MLRVRRRFLVGVLSTLGCVAALSQAGCGEPTSLLLSLSLGDAVRTPEMLRIRMYGAGEVITPALVPVGAAKKHLPGTVIVGPLNAGTPDFRVLIDGLNADGVLDSQVASRLQILAGQQMRVELVLQPPSADSDGDGVPDSIDDCPLIPDVDQRCTSAVRDDGGLVLADLSGSVIDGTIIPVGGGGDEDLADLSTDLSVPLPRRRQAPPDLMPAPDLGRCGHAGPIFCDDFESGDDSKWTGRFNGAPGKTSLTVQTTTAVNRYALDGIGQFNPNNTGTFTPTSYYLYQNYTVATPTTLSVRAYVYVPTNPGKFAMTLGLFRGTAGFSVGVDESSNWALTQDQGSGPDLHTTTAVRFGQFVCVELLLDIGKRLRLYVDNTLALDDVPALATVPNQLQAGLLRGPGNVPSEFIVDDVALGKARIGCN